ncbi:YajQ family cyclic di-GMP-binding protein [Parvibacter caecicola]|uniref:YajQ family cyclic di-GMP-binding protein n=1 Tax=Parvibacter caecicola TaxID=747645 RepID=UPI0023F01F90|nr:YajQ family cyclic di-GMP-binding protein [Parvibacter caecicola]
MAKEASFDIVSTVDMQEVDNAFQQAKKEIAQRYDLKDSGAEITLDKAKGQVGIAAPADFVAKQVMDVFGSKLIKRGIALSALSWGESVAATGGSVRRTGTVINGIEKETASKISKDIRDTKLKCKVQIEGDKLRVTSASRDTLQEVIAFVKGQDYGQPLQFTNYR